MPDEVLTAPASADTEPASSVGMGDPYAKMGLDPYDSAEDEDAAQNAQIVTTWVQKPYKFKRKPPPDPTEKVEVNTLEVEDDQVSNASSTETIFDKEGNLLLDVGASWQFKDISDPAGRNAYKSIKVDSKVYCEYHNLDKLMEDLYARLFLHKPDEPVDYMIGYLQTHVVRRRSRRDEANQLLEKMSVQAWQDALVMKMGRDHLLDEVCRVAANITQPECILTLVGVLQKLRMEQWLLKLLESALHAEPSVTPGDSVFHGNNYLQSMLLKVALKISPDRIMTYVKSGILFNMMDPQWAIRCRKMEMFKEAVELFKLAERPFDAICVIIEDLHDETMARQMIEETSDSRLVQILQMWLKPKHADPEKRKEEEVKFRNLFSKVQHDFAKENAAKAQNAIDKSMENKK